MAQYRVTPIWWPDGWEPNGPADMPKCVAEAGRRAADEPVMELDQAMATVRGLNRQNMDHPGTTWYVVSEVSEVSEDAGSAGASGPLRVVLPDEAGRGDCSHCPAHHLPCATED